MAFYIVHASTPAPDHLLAATVVHSFDTVGEAFAACDRLIEDLRIFCSQIDEMELVVVDEERQRVERIKPI